VIVEDVGQRVIRGYTLTSDKDIEFGKDSYAPLVSFTNKIIEIFSGMREWTIT